MNIQIVGGLLLPFLGTSLGAAMVFFFKRPNFKKPAEDINRFCGRCNGCRIFPEFIANVFGRFGAFWKFDVCSAIVGFLIGVGFLLFLDEVTPHMHLDNEVEGSVSNSKRTTKLILAVTFTIFPKEWQSALFIQISSTATN